MDIKSKRVFAFVDVENIRGAAQDAGYKDFNYVSLYEWLVEKHGIKRVYFFTAIDDGDSDKKQVFENLERKQECFVYKKEVKTYRTNNLKKVLKCPMCSHEFVKEIKISSRRKGNCDTELTLELMRQGIRKRYTHAIVFSGDGDFAKVYSHLIKELKKKITIIAPLGKLGNRTSTLLKDMDKKGELSILPLNDLFDKNCLK
jgi:uncharacterized LabA/DUF88 family protein